MSEREYKEFEQDDSPDEDAEENETSTPDVSWSYSAERTPHANRDAQREVLDGVYMPPQRKGNVSGGRNEVVLQNGRTTTRTGGNEKSRAPTHHAETNEIGTAPQARSAPADANIDQPISPPKEWWRADSPDHDKPPLTSTRMHTVRTHEKEIQDIDMADPQTIGGGGGKERGKTGTNPARNSKSGIPCDISTPPEASRTVAC